MSVQTQTAGRPILFGNAIAPVILERRELQAAGRPILFGDAKNPASLQKRSIDVVIPEIQTAGRPILFGDAKNPASLQKRGQESSPFRIFPFNHAPTRKTGLVTRQNTSPEDMLNLNDLLAFQQLAQGPGSDGLTCEYKKGFSDETDPSVVCPYANKLQSGCMSELTPEKIKTMTPDEMIKAGQKCATVVCAEIKAGRFLKEMKKCINTVCEENKETMDLLEKAVGAMEKTACPLIEALKGETDEDEDKATSSTSANGGLKTSTTAAAAGSTKTGDAEETDDEDASDAVKAPVQEEESSAMRLGSGWKNTVLVGALVFGSLFSML